MIYTMFARILKGAPFGNQNAKGHGDHAEKPADKPKWVDPRGKPKEEKKQPPQPTAQDVPQDPPKPEGKKNQGGTKSLNGFDIQKRLEKEGWEATRNNGHQIMKKPGHKPVPIPNHKKDIGIGLLKAIQKQTGVIF